MTDFDLGVLYALSIDEHDSLFALIMKCHPTDPSRACLRLIGEGLIDRDGHLTDSGRFRLKLGPRPPAPASSRA